jgi:hypothetical protein
MIYWHKIKDISINSGKLCTYMYFTYKDTFKFEEYLHIKTFTYRQILCKFRISAHSLRIETGRYKKTKDSSGNYSKLEKENRICIFCNLRMGGGISFTALPQPYICVCLKLGPGFPSPYGMVFFIFYNLR